MSSAEDIGIRKRYYQEYVTPDELFESLEVVANAIKKTREEIVDTLTEKNNADLDKVENRINNLTEQVKRVFENINTRSTKDVNDLLKNIKSIENDLQTKFDKKFASIVLPDVTPFLSKTDYEKDRKAILKEAKSYIKEIEPETGEIIRNKLENLEDDERLDKSAIKGLDDYDDKLATIRKSISLIPKGGGGIEVFNSTGKVGSGSSLKFIGTGVSSVTNVDGNMTVVDITGGEGGSQTPWTSNINAAGYTLHGNSTSGGTLTLSSTSHATKGKILFGTSAYDEVNDRLGIGTTAPSSRLHSYISSGSATELGIFENISGTSQITIKGNTSSRSEVQFSDGAVSGHIRYSHADDSMRFTTNGTEKLTILSSNSVGIATASPVGLLNLNTGTSGITTDVANQVAGTISFGNHSSTLTAPTMVGKSNTSVGLQFISAVNDGQAGGDMIFNIRENDNTDFATTNSIGFSFKRFSTDLVTIMRDGSIGTGTISPSAKIHSLSTTEQLRLGYDASNYLSTTVASTGSTTFALTGTSPTFTFSQAVTVNSTVTTSRLLGPIQTNSTTDTSSNLWVSDGASRVSTNLSQYTFAGAGTISLRVGIRGGTTGGNDTANRSYASFVVGSNGYTTATSGTNALIAGTVLKPTIITNGGSTVTNTATLYVESEATATVSGANYAIWSDAGTNRFDGDIDIGSVTTGVNVILDSTTGTKIGTATSQKLGLWNATPIVQPTTGVTAAAFAGNTSGISDDSATYGGYTMGQVVAALKSIGALA